MGRPSRYSPELRGRAIRLVQEHAAEHPSQWAAIESIASKVGCTSETLRKWVRQAERDAGQRRGLTTDERQRFKELERENRELKRTNELLRMASAYFAQAELDRRGSDAPLHRWPSGGLRGQVGLRAGGIAPSTYFLHKARERDPRQGSARAQQDDVWRREIQRVWDANHQVYGPRKVWKPLRRDAHRIARCTGYAA